jgi:hypothetical protein
VQVQASDGSTEQEVVRWFFRVGGAAGPVANGMSAYDVKISDAIYGQAERYAFRSAGSERCSTANFTPTLFFAFADTVMARSYRDSNA